MHFFLSLPLPEEISLRERGEIKAGAVCVIKAAVWSSFTPCDMEAGVGGRTATAVPGRGAFHSKTNPDNRREPPDAALLARLKLKPAACFSHPCFTVVSPLTCPPSSCSPKAWLFGEDGKDKDVFPGEQDLECFPSWKHEPEELDTHPCNQLPLCWGKMSSKTR